MSTTRQSPIILALATGRDDKGKTDNYNVYEGGGRIKAKNKRGEEVLKNAILGGNGTVYVAQELSSGIDAYVLVPKPLWDELWTATGRVKRPPELQNIPAPAPTPKKGGKK